MGAESTKQHPDHELIGFNNWQSFEVQRSVDAGNKIVVVKIDSSYDAPIECYDIGAQWVNGFTQDGIINALNNA